MRPPKASSVNPQDSQGLIWHLVISWCWESNKGHWSEDDISHVCVMWHRYSTFRCAGKLLMDAGQPKRQQAPARAAPRQPASALGYHTDMCRCLASLLGDDNRVYMFFLGFVHPTNQQTIHPSMHPCMCLFICCISLYSLSVFPSLLHVIPSVCLFTCLSVHLFPPSALASRCEVHLPLRAWAGQALGVTGAVARCVFVAQVSVQGMSDKWLDKEERT